MDRLDSLCKRWKITEYTPVNGLVHVHQSIYIDHLQKTFPENFFFKVDGDFIIRGSFLESLKHGPVEVGGGYDVTGNLLTNIEGAPRKVGRSFIIKQNPVQSLKGGPDRVENAYDCSETQIKNLEYIAGYIGGVLDCELTDIMHPYDLRQVLLCDSVYEIRSRYHEANDLINEYLWKNDQGRRADIFQLLARLRTMPDRYGDVNK